jgi:hypothetical protein
MTDFVRILQSSVELLGAGHSFYYGSDAHLNLMQTDLNPEEIYFLLFPVTRKAVINQNGTSIRGYNFTGRIFILKGSDYAKHYFNENGLADTDSKYTQNIEPLLLVHKQLANALMCSSDIDVVDWSCKDAVNVLDANKDGVWCTYNVNVLN